MLPDHLNSAFFNNLNTLEDISPAFDCAVEDEIIIKNPVQSKRLLINTDKGDHHKAIPPELMKHVRKHMDSLPRRERCIVALLCYTGLRFEEILGLQWNDIDLEAREIKIQRASCPSNQKSTACETAENEGKSANHSSC